MARAIGDKGDLIGVRAARLWAHIIQNGKQRLHKLKIAALIFTANIIAAVQRAFLQNGQQRIGMIFDIKPVAHIGSIPIDRQGRSGLGIQDHHRNELFGEVERAVIVGTIGMANGRA